MSSPARKQAASTEPKSPTSTGNDVLYDLALKRYDFITKAFDTSNSRASAIFAFSSLLVTGSVAALQKMVTENFHEEIVQWCVTIDLSIFLILAICCLFAYGITQIWTLPDALKLHPELARLSTERAKEQILSAHSQRPHNSRHRSTSFERTGHLVGSTFYPCPFRHPRQGRGANISLLLRLRPNPINGTIAKFGSVFVKLTRVITPKIAIRPCRLDSPVKRIIANSMSGLDPLAVADNKRLNQVGSARSPIKVENNIFLCHAQHVEGIPSQPQAEGVAPSADLKIQHGLACPGPCFVTVIVPRRTVAAA